MHTTHPALESAVSKLVREYSLASEKLTEEVMTKAILEAIACGDFVTHIAEDTRWPKPQEGLAVNEDGKMVATIYMSAGCYYQPYARVADLEAEIDRLRAVVDKLEEHRVDDISSTEVIFSAPSWPWPSTQSSSLDH